MTSDPGLTNALNVLKNIPKYFFLTLLVLTSGQTTQAAKEKEKATNETGFFHNLTGSLVMGDALVNLAPHGLILLPDKYCTDPLILKKSLGKLLDLPVRRIFFAHGHPILSSPLTSLAKILTSDPSS